MPLRPPIVVNESPRIEVCGELHFFEDPVTASETLFPYWEVNPYHFFDSDGRLLRVTESERQLLLEPAEEAPTHGHLLRRLLMDHARRIGLKKLEVYEGWLANATLGQLIEKCRGHGDRAKRKRWFWQKGG